MKMPPITIGIKSDTRAFQRTCRVIAKHMTALADELAELESDDLITVAPEPVHADDGNAYGVRYNWAEGDTHHVTAFDSRSQAEEEAGLDPPFRTVVVRRRTSRADEDWQPVDAEAGA